MSVLAISFTVCKFNSAAKTRRNKDARTARVSGRITEALETTEAPRHRSH